MTKRPLDLNKKKWWEFVIIPRYRSSVDLLPPSKQQEGVTLGLEAEASISKVRDKTYSLYHTFLLAIPSVSYPELPVLSAEIVVQLSLC
jgi:hypothetical protein